MGKGCLKYANPRFRPRAASGFNIIVAGTAFGCGSLREIAVLALKGKLSMNYYLLILEILTAMII
jgi:3-isopropylmalate dehydratase small subunit